MLVDGKLMENYLFKNFQLFLLLSFQGTNSIYLIAVLLEPVRVPALICWR